ncbi:hypothetical protein PMIT1313_01178 [Prochlorococcus marinus str. MIT 1313]|nr:hypothetical protein PMIT1313_01178 [Prochlorococcus marinus str. MIT 1313]KZR72563.1 hypothetical protein PMIT1318_01077 [Prochlorococcus marinus str. MIT 1318]
MRHVDGLIQEDWLINEKRALLGLLRHFCIHQNEKTLKYFMNIKTHLYGNILQMKRPEYDNSKLY